MNSAQKITFKCAKCGRYLNWDAGTSGMSIECPYCHASATVPNAVDPSDMSDMPAVGHAKVGPSDFNLPARPPTALSPSPQFSQFSTLLLREAEKQTEILASIRGWVTFLGVMALVSLIAAIILGVVAALR